MDLCLHAFHVSVPDRHTSLSHHLSLLSLFPLPHCTDLFLTFGTLDTPLSPLSPSLSHLPGCSLLSIYTHTLLSLPFHSGGCIWWEEVFVSFSTSTLPRAHTPCLPAPLPPHHTLGLSTPRILQHTCRPTSLHTRSLSTPFTHLCKPPVRFTLSHGWWQITLPWEGCITLYGTLPIFSLTVGACTASHPHLSAHTSLPLTAHYAHHICIGIPAHTEEWNATNSTCCALSHRLSFWVGLPLTPHYLHLGAFELPPHIHTPHVLDPLSTFLLSALLSMPWNMTSHTTHGFPSLGEHVAAPTVCDYHWVTLLR